jgi:hypothetical protein
VIFLDEAKIYFSCPDKTTAAECKGKVKFRIQSYRIPRGRGAFVISVRPFGKCNRCGRKFKVDEEFTGATNHVIFAPLYKKQGKPIKPRRAK